MRATLRFIGLMAVTGAVAVVGMTPASAKCTRLAFSVNDYGKDGPIKDAKRLLDGYIKKWTAERGISGYRVGKKDVSCELFLDFIVFDEHTCRAEATVCWGDQPAREKPQSADSGTTKSAKQSAPAASAAEKPVQRVETAPAAAPGGEAPAQPVQRVEKSSPVAPAADVINKPSAQPAQTVKTTPPAAPGAGTASKPAETIAKTPETRTQPTNAAPAATAVAPAAEAPASTAVAPAAATAKPAKSVVKTLRAGTTPAKAPAQPTQSANKAAPVATGTVSRTPQPAAQGTAQQGAGAGDDAAASDVLPSLSP